MTDLTLWYRQPATVWAEALPVGNGGIGAMIFGGVEREKLQLSEVTCVSGEASEHNNRSDGIRLVSEIRDELLAGNYRRADELSGNIISRKLNYGTNLPVGMLTIDFPDHGASATGYRRQLDLENATSTISYRIDDVQYRRESFISNPDQIFVMSISAKTAGTISCSVALNGGENPFQTAIDDIGDILLDGMAHEGTHSDGQTGVTYHCRLRCIVEGGEVRSVGSSLEIQTAASVQLLLAVATDFQGVDPGKECLARLERAADTPVKGLRKSHVDDYRRLFARVTMQLSSTVSLDSPLLSSLSTDERLEQVKNGGVDPSLTALMFQYGRYLLISSSREDSPLPAHLQGAWNDNLACRIGWTCDMHLDINTQMNYWPAEVTNLSECSLPLFSWIRNVLAPSGRHTAHELYGLNGWVGHIVSNAWGFSAPGWSTRWGLHVTGGAWIATHLWEHYLFTQDLEFLESIAFPVLREACEFFIDYLIVDSETGYLLSGPSCSPENVFHTDDGVYANSLGTTCDNVILRALFTACIDAEATIEVDDEFLSRCRDVVQRLPPLKVGADGRLQEWLGDFPEPEPQHRHTSHLLGLYPFDEICPERTPDLADAARASINGRTNPPESWEDTGRARSMLMLYAARLRDGNAAQEHILSMQRTLTESNLLVFHPPVAGAHAPVYELDGNTGLCACIAEMLLQSHRETIHLLPALPEAWATGEVTGLRARGGFTVDISWEDGVLVGCTLYPEFSDTCRIQYRGTRIEHEAVAGRGIVIEGVELRRKT